MHKQDPEKVQWESRCHFSHVVLMGAWRVNILTFFSSDSPVLVLLGLLTWMGRWEIDGFGALTDSSLGAPLRSSLRELSITITSNWSEIIPKKMGTIVMVTALNTVVNQLPCNYRQNRYYRRRGNHSNRRLVHSVCFNSCFQAKINQIWRYLLYFQLDMQQFKGCDSLYY